MSHPRGPLAKLYDPSHPVTESLLKRGYAIVRVCSEEEANRLADGIWNDLESMQTGICRHSPSSWTSDKLPQHTHGLLQNQNMGLRKGVCAARLSTKPVFESIFAGRECISSFDAITFSTPAMQQREFAREQKFQTDNSEPQLLSSWLHTDQAKTKPDCGIYVQGAFALTDWGKAEKKTQIVVPRLEETMQDFRDRFVKKFPALSVAKGKFDPEREEWIKHSMQEREWLLANGRIVSPILNKGEMLLWDSGLPHGSLPGPCSTTRNLRMGIFVSARPVQLITYNDVIVRRHMLEKGHTSGHRVTSLGKRTYRQCKFSETGQVYGSKRLPEYDKSGVLSGFKDAFERGDETSVEYGTAVFCGAYGLEHKLLKDF